MNREATCLERRCCYLPGPLPVVSTAEKAVLLNYPVLVPVLIEPCSKAGLVTEAPGNKILCRFSDAYALCFDAEESHDPAHEG